MLYLDFDGVLFDSSEETLKNFNYSLNELCLFHDLSSGDNVRINKYIEENRGRIGPIEDFFLILEGMPARDELVEFSLIKENLAFLVSKFLENRMIQKELSYEDWCLLHRPSELALLCMKEDFKFKVVSTKDEDSLADICRFFNISPKEIFGKESFEKFGSKKDIITYDMHKNLIHEAAIFDDNVDHLFINDHIKSYFVEWGYGDNTNYPCLNKNNLNEVLKQWI